MQRRYDRDSFVCVCNATYCDAVPSIGSQAPGQATLILSTRSEARFQASSLEFSDLLVDAVGDCVLLMIFHPTATKTVNFDADSALEIIVDGSITYQEIYGFGGAFTDAAVINIAKLGLPTQEKLIK